MTDGGELAKALFPGDHPQMEKTTGKYPKSSSHPSRQVILVFGDDLYDPYYNHKKG
jgi:hypothetical protein